jgi:hypothetical protein
MTTLGEDINVKVRRDKVFAAAYKKMDIIAWWWIIKYHATRDGSESVYVQAMKLLQLKQDGHPGAFARYVKTNIN